MPVYASDTERQVPNDFIFQSSSVFTDAGRLQAWIQRCSLCAEIHRCEARRDGGIGRSRVSVNVEVLVGLAVSTSSANVHIQRNRCLNEGGVISKQLAFAFAGEIPG